MLRLRSATGLPDRVEVSRKADRVKVVVQGRKVNKDLKDNLANKAEVNKDKVSDKVEVNARVVARDNSVKVVVNKVVNVRVEEGNRKGRNNSRLNREDSPATDRQDKHLRNRRTKMSLLSIIIVVLIAISTSTTLSDRRPSN